MLHGWHRSLLLLVVHVGVRAADLAAVDGTVVQECEGGGSKLYLRTTVASLLCRCLTQRNQSGRIFLLGDSHLNGMWGSLLGREKQVLIPAHLRNNAEVSSSILTTQQCTQNSSFPWWWLRERQLDRSQDRWPGAFSQSELPCRTAAHRPLYIRYTGVRENIACLATILFDAYPYPPTSGDVLLIQLGVHFSNDLISMKTSFLALLDQVVRRFPGLVLWMEPFPQHFAHGPYQHGIRLRDRSVEDSMVVNISGNISIRRECYPLSSVGASIFENRSALLHELVAQRDPSILNLRVVPTFELLRDRWRDHPLGTADCTHYTIQALEHVWRSVVNVWKRYYDGCQHGSAATPLHTRLRSVALTLLG